jgi:hypothetical protein
MMVEMVLVMLDQNMVLVAVVVLVLLVQMVQLLMEEMAELVYQIQ